MLKKPWLLLVLAVLVYGFWYSADFTVIATGVALFL